jgi:uncharacterized protein YqfB (UPF0267 family)
VTTLRFKAPLIDPILTGRKTQTLRARIPASIVRGSVIDAGCRYDRPAFARLRIVSVDQVELEELTQADAGREGLASLEELVTGVGRLYPDVAQLIRVRFELA